MPTESFARCRAAASAVRTAELGRSAHDTARPRSLLWPVRARGPLTLRLWAADRAGRVVWQSGGGFALVEPPEADPGPQWWAARLDRHWPVVVLFGPTVLLLLLAVPAVVVPVLALSMTVAALLWVAVLMAGFVARALVGLFRSGRRGRDPDRLAAEVRPGTHWHLPLCHQPDERRCGELLTLAGERTAMLVGRRIRAAAAQQGGVVRDAAVAEDLACLLGGATTRPMRAAMLAAAGSVRDAQDARVVLVTRPGADPAPPKLPYDTGSFAFWYVGGIAVVTLVLAVFVAGSERAACAPDACAGRPATFGGAVRWLLSNLVFADAGLTPDTRVWVFGLLYRILGPLSVLVLGVAAYRYVRWQQAQLDRLGRRPEMPKVLVLVAKQLERDAVVAAVKRATGASPRPSFDLPDVVFSLGELGGVEVLLAEAGGQGGTDPNGMFLLAADAGRHHAPRYVILCGVCFGLDDERQRIGDVLVSQRVIDVDHRAELEDRVVIRGVNVPPSRTLLSRVKAATVDPPPYGVHVGPMVHTSTLVNSSSARAELKRRVPHALGGDMESGWVYAAAAAAGLEWIVVKGISDRGADKTYAHQAEAAGNAADLVVRTLRQGGLAGEP